MLGAVHIPLPGGSSFALGATGGPLLVSLLLSGLGRAGQLDLRCPASFTAPVKELGLLLFYSSTGVQGGHGIAEILRSYGVLPVLCGVLFVVIPMLAGTDDVTAAYATTYPVALITLVLLVQFLLS